MGQRRKPGATGESAAEQETRDQEVLRANRELAAYFKGRRTEREARAALKIVKAFVRERERRDPRSRSPLPGADPEKTSKVEANRKVSGDGARLSKSVKASVELQANPDHPQLSDAGERTPR
jgi:hypothetical protein